MNTTENGDGDRILEGSMEHLVNTLGLDVDTRLLHTVEDVKLLYGDATFMDRPSRVSFPTFFYPTLFQHLIWNLWTKSKDKGRRFFSYAYPCRIVSRNILGFTCHQYMSVYRMEEITNRMLRHDKVNFVEYYEKRQLYERQEIRFNNGLKGFVLGNHHYPDSEYLWKDTILDMKKIIEDHEGRRDPKIVFVVKIYYRRTFENRVPVERFIPWISGYIPEKPDSDITMDDRTQIFQNQWKGSDLDSVRDLERHYYGESKSLYQGQVPRCIMIDATWVQWL